MSLVGLALLLAAPALQDPPSGAEAWVEQLAERTAVRRAAAREAWPALGAAWLELDPGAARGGLLEQLRELAPEVQEPALAALWAEAAAEQPATRRMRALLDLLGEVMNPAGAERLAAGRGRLPSSLRLDALEAALRGGSLAAGRAAAADLDGDPLTAGHALSMLLRYGPAERAEGWLAAAQLAQLDLGRLGAALTALAGRADLPEGFTLPETAFELRHSAFVRGALELLAVRPDRRAEDFVSAAARLVAADPSDRRLALDVAETAQAEQFPWRRILRELDSHLEDHPEDPLAEDVAWTLHRLGSRAGTSWLTDDLKDAVKANPRDYRARFRLGERYVALGMFKEGYREYREGIEELEGTPQFSRIDRETWLTAARAACGGRQYSDGLEWLTNARMSPRQLEPYRELPEFESALTKKDFRKLFGLQ
jgi:hypothetical protein